MKRLLLETDEWLRRRIRMCIWKSWKSPKTRISNLIRCGIPKRKAREWGYSRQGYWRIADSCITHSSITNERLSPKTRISNLIRCGIPKRKAREWGYSRQGYWRIADSCITHSSITNERLRIADYPTLYDEYLKWYPK